MKTVKQAAECTDEPEIESAILTNFEGVFGKGTPTTVEIENGKVVTDVEAEKTDADSEDDEDIDEGELEDAKANSIHLFPNNKAANLEKKEVLL